MMTELMAEDRIENCILFLRGHKVILDRDLAVLYEVQTKTLNQAVRRNRDRFPADFMFELTWEEVERLESRSQIVTLKKGKNIKYLPFIFTEQGVAMLASILKSPRAVHVNIEIMRAFVRLRTMIATHKGLAQKLEQLEKKYDQRFKYVFDAIRQLMEPPATKSKNPIGFRR
ncbi:MAG: ORF6N domain-containing protein [Deltaproteobacteria bacterium]|nr:ORF6N domain-containing protein [Deltaproteobacteria bacterium]